MLEIKNFSKSYGEIFMVLLEQMVRGKRQR